MQVLFITTKSEDYLQDQILTGLRNNFGTGVVDWPKKKVMYKTCNIEKKDLYGCGFTIWKTLEDINLNREDIVERIFQGAFDLVIFGSIWRQRSLFQSFQKTGIINSSVRFFFLDGEDDRKIFEPALRYGEYFKREYDGQNIAVRRINFTIPAAKIIDQYPVKDKIFAKHVQCDEAYKIKEIRENCYRKYAFDYEKSYYEDLSRSMYAITMKKGGWDCMRHYEIAANGAVICFHRLGIKTSTCAPHGLIDMENVVTFESSEELSAKIDLIKSQKLYKKLQDGSLLWVKSNTCEAMAGRLIEIAKYKAV